MIDRLVAFSRRGKLQHFPLLLLDHLKWQTLCLHYEKRVLSTFFDVLCHWSPQSVVPMDWYLPRDVNYIAVLIKVQTKFFPTFESDKSTKAWFFLSKFLHSQVNALFIKALMNHAIGRHPQPAALLPLKSDGFASLEVHFDVEKNIRNNL